MLTPDIDMRVRIAPTATNNIPKNQFLQAGRILQLFDAEAVYVAMDNGSAWCVMNKDLLPDFNVSTKTLNETLTCL